MHSTNAVLLPDVFDPKVVRLGYILRNPLEPSVKKFVPSEEALQDAAAEMGDEVVTQPFRATLSLDKTGSFSVSVTRFLGMAVGGEHARFLEVEAERLTEQSFADADVALARICRDNTALEEWIKPFASLRKPVYFVIGMQTLHNATFRTAVGSGATVEAYATLPIDASAQMIPVNVRAQLTRRGTGTSGGTVSGVFGLKVLKGTWSIFQAAERPRWEGKPYWTWVYETKGGADVEKLTGLELHELDQDDLEELQRERWADEEEAAEDDDDDDI